MNAPTPPSGFGQMHRRVLPEFLFDLDQPKPLYALKAWLLCLIPSFILALIVSSVATNPPSPDFGGTGLFVFAMIVLFAPITETLLMTPPLLILNRLFGPGPAMIGSALLWGALHSAAEPLWGLIIWWPFLILSAIVLAWRKRSLGAGMAMAMLVHAMQNSVAGFPLLFS